MTFHSWNQLGIQFLGHTSDSKGKIEVKRDADARENTADGGMFGGELNTIITLNDLTSKPERNLTNRILKAEGPAEAARRAEEKAKAKKFADGCARWMAEITPLKNKDGKVTERLRNITVGTRRVQIGDIEAMNIKGQWERAKIASFNEDGTCNVMFIKTRANGTPRFGMQWLKQWTKPIKELS